MCLFCVSVTLFFTHSTVLSIYLHMYKSPTNSDLTLESCDIKNNTATQNNRRKPTAEDFHITQESSSAKYLDANIDRRNGSTAQYVMIAV